MDDLRISVITDNFRHHSSPPYSQSFQVRPRPLYTEPLLLYFKNYSCKVFQNRFKLFRPFFL